MAKTLRRKSKKFDPEELNELFGLTVVKTVRIPTNLFQDVEAAAKKCGSSFNEAVVTALRAYLGLPSEDGALFIQKLFAWVTQTYRMDDFPENVTHLMFQHIQKEPELFAEYQRITQRREDKETINRKIGKMVKQAMNAVVIGRSLPIRDRDSLITSYALLRPNSEG